MENTINEILKFNPVNLLLQIADMNISEEDKMKQLLELHKTLNKVNVTSITLDSNEAYYTPHDTATLRALEYIGIGCPTAMRSLPSYINKSSIKDLIDWGYLDKVDIPTMEGSRPGLQSTNAGIRTLVEGLGKGRCNRPRMSKCWHSNRGDKGRSFRWVVVDMEKNVNRSKLFPYALDHIPDNHMSNVYWLVVEGKLEINGTIVTLSEDGLELALNSKYD